MRRFKGIAVLMSAVLAAPFMCACKNVNETNLSSESIMVSSSQTASVTVTTTETTVQTTQETSETTLSETLSETTSASDTAKETKESLNTAGGKFNYVLKNKKWKFDGEMYYHKYKDGTTVYYDKEAKSYFVMDSKGQGWYYNPDIKDFVRDE